MRVLVACEFSGTVRDAFIAAGHDAWSCDLLPTEKPGPHFQCDVREVLGNGWDLMIAHPPCTYLSRAGARWMYAGGRLNSERLAKASEAKALFMALFDATIARVAVENPRPLSVVELPPYSQVIQPFEFGEPYSKATCLWLRGLPPLMATAKAQRWQKYLPTKSSGQRGARGKERSRTFPGIAQAMADQWGKGGTHES